MQLLIEEDTVGIVAVKLKRPSSQAAILRAVS